MQLMPRPGGPPHVCHANSVMGWLSGSTLFQPCALLSSDAAGWQSATITLWWPRLLCLQGRLQHFQGDRHLLRPVASAVTLWGQRCSCVCV